jgi:hypothetical protein
LKFFVKIARISVEKLKFFVKIGRGEPPKLLGVRWF